MNDVLLDTARTEAAQAGIVSNVEAVQVQRTDPAALQRELGKSSDSRSG